jgi:uncharacterized repeat protein (TIGR03803 family)
MLPGAFRPAIAGLVLAFATWSRAQVPEQILRSFGNVSQSGGHPVSVLAGPGGVLYGITAEGGLYGQGTVFRVNADGSDYAVLRAFGEDTNDAATPTALLEGRDGVLYGVTSAGGTNSSGVLFKVATDGSGYTTIYEFGSFFGDAATPVALIQGVDGDLYGTAEDGGTNGLGAAFSIGTDGSAYNILYNFGNNLFNFGDGTNPTELTQGSDGALYGVAQSGTNSAGVVFRLSTNGSTYAVIYSFGESTNDASDPIAVAQSANGVLFGVAQDGGTNGLGAIFTLHTNGSGYSLVYSFTGTSGDGATPGAGLIRGQDGSWYGTTLGGGSDQHDGTVFRLNANGSGYEVIRRFTVITSVLYDTFSTDGQQPGQLAQATDGLLYGVTAYGGTTGQGAYSGTGAGTLFALATNASYYAVVYDFSTNGADADFPVAGLVTGGDGALYGTSKFGGPAGQGSVFKINLDGSGYQFLYGFGTIPIDGLNPESGLSVGADGALYGTTSVGGYEGGSGSGIVFKINPDGTGYTELHSFGFLLSGGLNGQLDGQVPTAPPISGKDGNLYGTTSNGGNPTDWGGFGVVYKLGTNGLGYSVLHFFSTNNLEGRSPQGGVIQGADGALYGTTPGGPASTGVGTAYGNVFRILTDGTGFQVLHTFTNGGAGGMSPYAGLIFGPDGLLYGTTRYGGSNNFGTIFKLGASGSNYQVIYNFGSVTNDGQNPTAALIQGRDGYLYGTTSAGGLYGLNRGFGYGVAFKISTNGSGYTILYNFGAGSTDGQSPLGGLVQGLDGAFYGTTSLGGILDSGTVFRLGPSPFEFSSLSRLPNRTMLMALSGPSNTSCRIDASTNLVNWVTLATLQNTNGSVQFIDTTALGFSRRFYRAFQGP